MKCVILAGGLGTRLSEETYIKPKPMVEIGGYPILWHLMKFYSSFSINDFIICLGYKGYMIKEYFCNYLHHTSDLTINLKNGLTKVHKSRSENWKVTLIDTGEYSMTGGRLLRVKHFLEKEKCFCLTYGDGLSNVNLNELIKFHKQRKKIATVTAVSPPGRFGALEIDKNLNVKEFKEKPKSGNSFINGGFFVLSPKIFDYCDNGDNTIFEENPLQNLALNGELCAFKHNGFWQPMDTLRDKNQLEKLWSEKNAPWKNWTE